MKRLDIIIAHCRLKTQIECPFCFWDEGEQGWFCVHPSTLSDESLIFDMSDGFTEDPETLEIPKWCPLPNKD